MVAGRLGRRRAWEARLTRFDRIVLVANGILLSLLMLLYIVPIANVVANSLSVPSAVLSGRVWLLPVGWNLEIYREVLTNLDVLMGYGNSIFYTIAGTLLNLLLTVAAAYPLSNRELRGRGFFMFLFTFTMFFSGGMIPTFFLVRGLGLVDTRWSLLLPGALSVMNMIIARTYFQSSIPKELHDCSALDGASDMQILRLVVLPLSKPLLAVLALYYAIDHWNSYFDALIYLSRKGLLPLQIVIRDYVFTMMIDVERESAQAMQVMAKREVLKYGLIVMGSLPVILMYPFIQNYLTKGVMIGSLKG